jgi:hypothetical protein
MNHAPVSLLRVGPLAAALALAACGGGSDPRPDADPATAPVITSAPQDTTVREGGSADFTVAGTSGDGTLAYAWSQLGQGAISGASSATLRLDAVSLLDHGHQFTATLSNNAGSTTSTPATLSVTERSWAAPITPMSAGAGRPEMATAVDSEGTTHIAYTELNADFSTTLHVATKSARSDIPLSAHGGVGNRVLAPSETHQQLSLVPGPGNTVLLVWREGLADSSGNVLKAALAHGSEGSGLAELGVFSGPAAADADRPVAVRLADDGYELAWREHDGTRWNVLTRRFTLNAERNGGQWGNTVAAEASDLDFTGPLLAADAQGNLMLAFSTVASTTEGPERTWTNARPAGAAGWDADAAQLSDGLPDTQPARASALALDAHGRAVLLMRSDQTRVYMRQYQFGASPGWVVGPAYVANRWDGLPDAVEPVLVMHDAPHTLFSILSVHNNGRSISRWPCGPGGCESLQGVVGSASDMLDLRAARDAAGNYIVAFTMTDLGAPGNSLPYALRFHAGLDAWRGLAPLGADVVSGRLELVMSPDGRATLAYPALQGSTDIVPRTSDFR